mmetsp:Transcript_42742/g.72933  ORF Transcript_42742/g.72933 Transcript_42742/m.72933 type:complete len:133 (-) Transcript_42742:9-407(-)
MDIQHGLSSHGRYVRISYYLPETNFPRLTNKKSRLAQVAAVQRFPSDMLRNIDIGGSMGASTFHERGVVEYHEISRVLVRVRWECVVRKLLHGVDWEGGAKGVWGEGSTFGALVVLACLWVIYGSSLLSGIH